MNKDEIKLFQLRKGFIKDYIPNQIKAVQTRARKVASTAITTDSTATVVNTNVQPQVQLLKQGRFITLLAYILKKTSLAVSRAKQKKV